MNILEIEDLNIYFHTRQGPVWAIKNLSISLPKGKCFGVVGESGSGKSITALSIMDLLPPNASIQIKDFRFKGKKMKTNTIKSLRGKEIAMIFQDPMTSLNPCYSIGFQLREHLENKKEAKKKAIQLLEQVGISEPELRLNNYPHQLSGGMLQRVMIAIAIARRPKLLIADEPTTALDLTIQAQILKLLEDLRKETGMSMILISHNMGVVAENASKVLVMYAGELVELAPTRDLITDPRHPYTKKLLSALPDASLGFKKKLSHIPGIVPNLHKRPSACQFHPRCEYMEEACRLDSPPTFTEKKRSFKCWKPLFQRGKRKE